MKKNVLKLLLLSAFLFTLILSLDSSKTNAAELENNLNTDLNLIQPMSDPSLENPGGGGGSVATSASVEFVQYTGYITMEISDIYLNKDKTQSLYNESTSGSSVAMFSKYLIGLVPKIGPIIAGGFVLGDISKNEFNKQLKNAIDSGLGVKIRTIKTTGRSNSTGVTVTTWNMLPSSVQLTLSGYTRKHFQINY